MSDSKITTEQAMTMMIVQAKEELGRELTTDEVITACAELCDAVINGDLPCERDAFGGELSMN